MCMAGMNHAAPLMYPTISGLSRDLEISVDESSSADDVMHLVPR
jgi:hypothetical protein